MTHRVFLAIRPPEELIAFIQDVQAGLAKLNLPLTPIDPDNLHLTLNYFGRVDDVLLHTLQFRTLPKLFESRPPFSLKFSFLETMYRKHEPSFVYLMPTGDTETLKSVQLSVSEALNEVSLPQDRKFMPHINIGEFEKSDPETTKSNLQKVADFDFQPSPEFRVDFLTLFEATLTRGGAHYKKLARFRFATGQ